VQRIDVVFAVADQPVTDSKTGISGYVRKGSHWPADDPVVKAHPDLFSTDPRFGMNYSVEPDGYDAPVEQATAGPGEKRQVRRG
jgi:hypothetical protein